MVGRPASLHKHLWAMAGVVGGGTVAFVKLIP